MAIIINTVDTNYFVLNNIRYPKIYNPLKQGLTHIGIYNVYDTNLQILPSTRYNEFRINGNSYSNQKDVITALLPVILSSQAGGGGGPIITGGAGTGLQAINEGNGIGWRLKGRDPVNYGNIGLNGVDLSFSSLASDDNGATGQSSLAIGVDVIASGATSFASGRETLAGGIYSNAHGYGTKALKTYSTANGFNTTASGATSFVWGNYNTTIGLNSTAWGNNNIAQSAHETVFGTWGTLYTPISLNGSSPTDRLVNIGNGTGSGTRSDAFQILKNGVVLAPDLDNGKIFSHPNGKVLITRDFAEAYFTSGSTSLDRDDYVDSGAFSTSTGDVTLTRLSGGTVNYNLDGRYSLIGHSHPISGITGLASTLSNFVTLTDNQTVNGGKTFIVAPKSTQDAVGATDLVRKSQFDTGINSKENNLGIPDFDGYVLASTTGGTRSWVYLPGSGGALEYINLTDKATVDLPTINTPLNTALGLKEDDLGLPAVTGYVLTSTDTGVRSWVAQTGGGGSGASTYVELTDGTSVDLPTINTPLSNALGLKANQSTTYTKAETDNLVNAKADQSTTYTKVEVNGLVNVKEDDLGNPSTNGDVLTSTTSGVRSWITIPDGITTYAGLSDKASVDLPSINTPLSNALGLKANQSTTYTKVETTNLVNTKEDVLGNPLTNGRILSSQTDGSRSWIELPSGVTTYAGLSDKATVDLPTINTPLSNALGLKANDTDVVKITGNQTVGGAKTFTLVPKSSQDASASTDLVRKSQFDTKEDLLGNPSTNGKVLTSTTGGTRSWIDIPGSNKTIKVVNGTTYTLLETDTDYILHFTHNDGCVLTVPTSLPLNNRYEGIQMGTGQVEVVEGVGVNVRYGASETNKSEEKYSVFALDVITTNEYVLFGKLELVDSGVTPVPTVTTYDELSDKASVDLPTINIPLNTALGLKEDDLGNPSTTGRILSSTDTGVRSWIELPSGVSTYAALTDKTSVDLPTINTPLNTALGLKEDKLGNPGYNGFVLASTTSGVRTWVELTNGYARKDIKVVSSSTYTINVSDKDKILHFTHNTGCIVTVPEVSTYSLDIKNVYQGVQMGTGQVTIIPVDSSVDIYVTPTEKNKTEQQYSVFTLESAGANKYLLFGKLELQDYGSGGTSGTTTYAGLTDSTSVDLPVMNTPLSNALGLKANDTDVVKLTGNQTINDAKTFSTVPKSSQDASASTDLVRKSQFDTKEDDLGNPSTDGYVLASTTGGTRSWVAQSSGGGGGGNSPVCEEGLITVNASYKDVLIKNPGKVIWVALRGIILRETEWSQTGTSASVTVTPSNVNGLRIGDYTTVCYTPD